MSVKEPLLQAISSLWLWNFWSILLSPLEKACFAVFLYMYVKQRYQRCGFFLKYWTTNNSMLYSPTLLSSSQQLDTLSFFPSLSLFAYYLVIPTQKKNLNRKVIKKIRQLVIFYPRHITFVPWKNFFFDLLPPHNHQQLSFIYFCSSPSLSRYFMIAEGSVQFN